MMEKPAMPSHLPAEGGCLCGAIRYRIAGTPIALTICHCRTCRMAAGAPTVAWTDVFSRDFRWLSGAPTEHESSPGVLRGFCGRCGTPLSYRRTAQPDRIDLTTLSLDRPQDFAPTKEIWVSHRIAWEAIDPALPQYAGSGVDADSVS
jgi:hypothetical protein